MSLVDIPRCNFQAVEEDPTCGLPMYRWGTEKLWAWVCAQHDLNYPPEKALDAPK